MKPVTLVSDLNIEEVINFTIELLQIIKDNYQNIFEYQMLEHRFSALISRLKNPLYEQKGFRVLRN